MPLEIFVNATSREVRIALLENQILQDLFIERRQQQELVGNIYKGKITRILPGMQAAFIDIGFERAGFLHSHDIGNEKLDILEKVRVGQDILVQVSKESLGSKGPRLTTRIALPSRYLVFTPGSNQCVISQKIIDEHERERLLSLVASDGGHGFIIRTAAANVTAEAIEADKKILFTQWQKMSERIKTQSSPSTIFEEISPVLRIIRDIAHQEVTKIRVDDLATHERMRDFIQTAAPHWLSALEYYAEIRPLFDVYSIEQEIQKALGRKIYLKSGGHLIFDQTEAMSTIDVNTGSFTGSSDLEETIFKTNLEAVEVIMRQIRLRNLGGMIIVDFIDMQSEAHQSQLLAALREWAAKDKMHMEISEISRLGLVQITRKRTRESLENILCVTCPVCQHRGTVKSFETLASEIVRDLRRTANLFPWEGFLVLASPGVVDYLLKHEAPMLAELEQQIDKPIQLRAERSYMQEKFDILPLSKKD